MAMCGVYYLLDGVTVLYVGSSKNIARRLSQHKRNINFDLYCYDECEESELLSREAEAIKQFHPILNRQSVLSA